MIRWVLAGLVALVASVVGVGVVLFSQLGAFHEVTPRFEGDCRQVPAPAGAEDMAYDAGTGTVLLSATDRRKGVDQRGGIYGFAAGALPDQPSWTDLTRGRPALFQPLGLDVHRSGAGPLQVFVVNRAADFGDGTTAPAIEIFEMRPSGYLAHLETVFHRAIRSPNDIAALGSRAFYVTNDLSGRGGGMRQLLEVVFKRPVGSVAFYDDGEARVVAEGLRFANGVALSSDRRRLYVSELLGRRVVIYDRGSASGAVEDVDAIPLDGFFPDNLTLDEEGRLWIGAHGNMPALSRHASDPETLAPGAIFRAQTTLPDQILRTSGLLISGLSVALPVEDRMYVGSVYEPHILDCRLVD